MTSIDILIAEDDAAHVRFIQRSLAEAEDQFEVRVTLDLRSCRDEITRRPPDVLLLDLNLPDGNALDLLKELGTETPYPILVMTAGGSEAMAVEALKSGALDYVVKSSETIANISRTVLRARRERSTREEHREAVRALRASEEKYRHLFQEFNGLLDAVSDSLMLVDTDMKILWTNQAAAARIDQEPEQMIGHTCYGLIKPSDIQCDACAVERTLTNRRNQNSIVTLENGETWDNRTFPLRDENGKIIKIIIMKRNITEQKSLQDEAARASRLAVLGELSAGVAHEINNPNALILHNSEMLHNCLNDLLAFVDLSGPEESNQLFGGLPYAEVMTEMPQLLRSIHDSARRIKRIVNDLRDFSRQDIHDHQTAVDLNQVATTSARLVSNAMKQATDHFIVDIAADLPPLLGDKSRLDQVVINLLMNAIQALENRNQKITLSTRCAIEQDQLFLIVCDEGRGMSADIMEHISEPFVTTKRQEGGSGLGLSVSARIVKEHGGTLDFTSTPGKGTTVTLTLPAIQDTNRDN
jgi:PAS domain S-box-containing protein